MMRDDEFYIGYEATMPPGLGRRVLASVVIGTATLVALAVVLTQAQRPLANASFDYGQHHTWMGLLVHAPAPAVLVPTAQGYRRFWLVGRGKHGADAALAGVGEEWVQVIGTLISRDPWRMIEVVSVTPAPAPSNALPPPLTEDGEGRDLTLRGEIVDSKCFLGVMNPGERVVHRDCALRCLSGGIPPMLAYRDEHGEPGLAVLVDAQGRLLHEAVHHAVGRPIEASGRLFDVHGQPVFQLASLSGVRR